MHADAWTIDLCVQLNEIKWMAKRETELTGTSSSWAGVHQCSIVASHWKSFTKKIRFLECGKIVCYRFFDDLVHFHCLIFQFEFDICSVHFFYAHGINCDLSIHNKNGNSRPKICFDYERFLYSIRFGIYKLKPAKQRNGSYEIMCVCFLLFSSLLSHSRNYQCLMFACTQQLNNSDKTTHTRQKNKTRQ